MMCREKQEILDSYDGTVNDWQLLFLEVLVDIRDRLETLCAVERKTLNESIRRNKKIEKLTKTLNDLPQLSIEELVEEAST